MVINKVKYIKKDEPTESEREFAHQLARTKALQHVNTKIEKLREQDDEFNGYVVDVDIARGMKRESKVNILTEYYTYWKKGEYEKVYEMHERLFDIDGRETFIPSDA